MTRYRAQSACGEAAFTLIELLVVILIIGILAAIAIPSFLSQKNKAADAQAKVLARSAATTAETIATDHGGSYASVSAETLKSYENTLNYEKEAVANPSFKGKAEIVESGLKEAESGDTSGGTNGSKNEYEVTAQASDGDTYTIVREENGTLKKECAEPKGASNKACLTGSW